MGMDMTILFYYVIAMEALVLAGVGVVGYFMLKGAVRGFKRLKSSRQERRQGLQSWGAQVSALPGKAL